MDIRAAELTGDDVGQTVKSHSGDGCARVIHRARG